MFLKRILLVLLTISLSFVLSSCNTEFDRLEHIRVGEYDVFRKDLGQCEMIFIDVEFTYEDTNYVISGGGCTKESQYYIKYSGEMIALQVAYDEGIVSGEELYNSGLTVYEEDAF